MISIIVPFYNTEKYLEECLSSIKAQTFSDFECLMIDDGSIDSSREIASRYLDDSRFKLLNKEHIGFPQAKNLGLDSAKGEYICFIDSDDFVDECYLEYLYDTLIETNTDISCCGRCSFRDNMNYKVNKEKHTRVYEDNRMLALFTSCSTFLWNKLYKREIFDGIRCEDVEALSDTMMTYKLFEKAKSVSAISSVLIFHRNHDENMTYNVRHFSPTYWEHRLNVYLTMCSYLCEHYSRFSRTYKSIFRGELSFIRPHLSQEVLDKYLEEEKVKLLLSK